MAHLARVTRSTMTGILNQEFIRVARAKGLGERTVVWRYALANAIGPVMTVAGLQVGYLFGSIIVVESLFNYTGMGWITYQALLNRDVPLIQTSVFVIAAVVMLVNSWSICFTSRSIRASGCGRREALPHRQRPDRPGADRADRRGRRRGPVLDPGRFRDPDEMALRLIPPTSATRSARTSSAATCSIVSCSAPGPR